MIPFSPPDIRDEDIDAVVSVLTSGWITSGPVGRTLSDELAAWCDTPDAVLVSSATTGLEAVLRFLGVGPGDEVITTSYTYSASAAAIAHVGARPILLDTAPGSFVPEPAAYAHALTERTAAVLPVDLGGVPYDYVALREALHDAGADVPIIADAAHSLGAERTGVRSGALADFTVFSFHAVKNLTTAEGGAITWRSRSDPNLVVPEALEGLDDAEVARQLTLGILHGQSKSALDKTRAGSWEYDIEQLGHKANMPDILAALGLSQLRRYEQTLARRAELVAAYDRALAPLGVTSLAHEGDDFTSSRHLYLVELPGDADRDAAHALEQRRNAIIMGLAERGVMANVHYKPLPLLRAYRDLGWNIADFPHAYRQYCGVISLPLHTLLTDEQVDEVADALEAELTASR
ncbi:MAG: DegT/DnrJ/EryC1/StrS aminotransferase family protein [Bowdeniella nasicola]|nr:DegT/DnrJ/EryC1/StrS aminotransferase family protein [Bowdeniella nasicola]